MSSGDEPVEKRTKMLHDPRGGRRKEPSYKGGVSGRGSGHGAMSGSATRGSGSAAKGREC